MANIRHHQLRTFQLHHKQWLEHNFPDQDSWDPLLGMVEEIGELAHAELKFKQGIRGFIGSEADKVIWHRTQVRDALGDILIYMASYCNTNNYDMAECLEKAWEEVSARDWIKFPTNGVDA